MSELICPVTKKLCGGLHCEPPTECERAFNARMSAHGVKNGVVPHPATFDHVKEKLRPTESD